MTFDPMGARFRSGVSLQPWQVSAKLFDFDPDFVRWICRYLEERKQPHGVTDAKAWINKGFFVLERFELVTLQWEAYGAKREERRSTSIAMAGDLVAGCSDGVGVVDDRDVPAPAELTPEQRHANLKRLREMVEKNKIGG
ncbi:hypothetical protein [Pseudanabaena sp. PCC 6802]|uniref:hypothetical protein n=1 Tax=Pseudanabaena sp. PCC 6802 TaxID=118173 RepID=UPI000348EE43|nr:hypothetical protein [Pseudanabaena sp. PCC 6802]